MVCAITWLLFIKLFFNCTQMHVTTYTNNPKLFIYISQASSSFKCLNTYMTKKWENYKRNWKHCSIIVTTYYITQIATYSYLNMIISAAEHNYYYIYKIATCVRFSVWWTNLLAWFWATISQYTATSLCSRVLMLVKKMC